MKTAAIVAATVSAILLITPLANARGKGSGTATSTYKASGGNHTVRGHVRKDGAYVPPHHTTNPNDTKSDNWSSKGNVNPYTGKQGTVDPYRPNSNLK